MADDNNTMNSDAHQEAQGEVAAAASEPAPNTEPDDRQGAVIADPGDGPLYRPGSGELQLTARALVVGCLIGGIVSCMNVYMGLKIGWSFGGSLIAAILGFATFRVFRIDLSVLETNITQTSGSGAGTMASAAGLLACIPALSSLGYEISTLGLFCWSFSVAYLGVFFAVPLRRQMVVVDKLRFPTGTATAQTILAMFAEAGEAIAKARALIWFGVGAGAFTVATYFVPQLEMPPIDALGIGVLSLAAAWTFKLYIGPMLLGAGLLIGPRVSFSMMGGAVLAWAVLAPMAQKMGWAPGKIMSYTDGPRGWILWPGVAIMVSEALTSLALNWRTFLRAFQRSDDASANALPLAEEIPNAWWMSGLAAASVLTVLVTWFVFDIPPYLSLLAVALSSVLAVVAVRSTGETDINPVGGMGKVSQLVYGGIAPGMVATNLLAAGITGSGASQAADMMQDLKTGHLLGASPRKQFKAQLIGIVAGIFFCVPAYLLVTSAYPIGGEQLPAPAAKAWAAVAELLSKGLGALPPMAGWASFAGVLVGAFFPLLKRYTKLGPWLPSGLAVGIAFIIPAFYSMVIAMGALALVIWQRTNPQQCERLSFAVASGLVAGEGIFGLVKAAMTLLGVPTLTGGGGGH